MKALRRAVIRQGPALLGLLLVLAAARLVVITRGSHQREVAVTRAVDLGQELAAEIEEVLSLLHRPEAMRPREEPGEPRSLGRRYRASASGPDTLRVVSAPGAPRYELIVSGPARSPRLTLDQHGALWGAASAPSDLTTWWVAPIDLSEWALERERSDGYSFEIASVHEGLTVPLTRSSRVPVEPLTVPVQLPGLSAEVRIAPTAGWRATTDLAPFLVVSSLAIFSLGTWLNSRARRADRLEGQLLESRQGLIAERRRRHDEVLRTARIEGGLEHLRNYDTKTGLLSRTGLVDLAERQLKALRSQTGAPVRAVALVISLRRLRSIEESLGEQQALALTNEIRERLAEILSPEAQLARLGIDTLATFFIGEETKRLEQSARNLLKALDAPLHGLGLAIGVNAQIGVAQGSAETDHADELLLRATSALTSASESGLSRIAYFDPQQQERALKRIALEVELAEAIEDIQFEPHYQPIIDLGQSRLVAFEALVRWRHPTRGLVPPLEFIPLAEETGQIADVDRCMIDLVCRDLARWRRDLGDRAPSYVSINLSEWDLRDAGTFDHIRTCLHHHGLPPECLAFEVTESQVIQDATYVRELLDALDGMGIRIFMDDFGTGYSSLSYLHEFPFHVLKIDVTFVKRVTEDGEHWPIVASILSMADSLGLSTVAEGIDEPYHHAMLRDHGCPYGQGFLYSRPVPTGTATDYLSHGLDILDDFSRNPPVARAS